MRVRTPEFNFRSTVFGHGWCELSPFRTSPDGFSLGFAFYSSQGPAAVNIRAEEGEPDIIVTCRPDSAKVIRDAEAVVRRMLCLDQDLTGFYQIVRRTNSLTWIANSGAGRLLRSPTVFEDVVKTILTTNCSWSMTRAMTDNLVGKLGDVAPGGSRVFPLPSMMAARDERFYRDEVRAGYRSAYLIEFAESVAAGRIDPEAWMDPRIPDEDLRRNLLAVKGVGKYAAENMMKLLGRFGSLALDSFLRRKFYVIHNGGQPCPDEGIEEHYERFGEWKGLAIWFDMCGNDG